MNINKKLIGLILFLTIIISACELEQNITPVPNRAPVADKNISATVAANKAIVIELKASDEDGDALTYFIQKSPSLGTLGLNGATVIYTAGATTGSDIFEFSVSDGKATDSAAVVVTVTAEQGTTVSAQPDSYTGLVNTLLVSGTTSANAAISSSKNILTNDNGAISVVAEDKATSEGGNVVITANGSFTYTPKTNFVGQDSFEYSLTDSAASPNKATVTLTVQEVDAKDSSNAAIAGNQKVIYIKTGSSLGDGSSAKPYGTLFKAQQESAVGDVIVLYSASAYPPAGGYSFEMKNHQKLLGQGAAVVINGEQVLPAGTPPVIRKGPAGESLPLFLSTGSLNENNLVVQRVVSNVTIKGLIIDRSDPKGGTADTGSGVSGIVMSDKSTGTILIEDVTIRSPGGFGITTAETDACLTAACTVPIGTTPPVKPVATHKLVLNRVTITNPGNSGVSSNDAISVTITDTKITNALQIEGKTAGRAFEIESEHPSTVTITNTTVESRDTKVKAFFFRANNRFRNLPNATMNVILSGNTADFTLTATNDTVAPIGAVDSSVGYEALVEADGARSKINMSGSSRQRNAESDMACTSVNADNSPNGNAQVSCTATISSF